MAIPEMLMVAVIAGANSPVKTNRQCLDLWYISNLIYFHVSMMLTTSRIFQTLILVAIFDNQTFLQKWALSGVTKILTHFSHI